MGSFLTRRQREILDFIRRYRERHRISPTHREIREEFGYSSYGTVHKHLKLLEKKGYLKRQWNQKRGVELTGDESAEARPLPFLGRIAAGRPIEAVADERRLAVPAHLLQGRRDEHYVLEVVGDSMIEDGIHDGDLVVVERREEAQPGEMVVALWEEDVTLKRYYPEGDEVRLQPSNPAMPPLRVPADALKLQGVVVGLMRRY